MRKFHSSQVARWSLGVSLALILWSGGLHTAYCAVFTVSKIADTNDGTCDSDCSLREAIAASNNQGGSNTIAFARTLFASTPQTITLSGTQITGTSNFTVVAPLGGVTIDGNHASAIFTFNSGTVSLSNLILVNGKNTNNGGAINNNTNLTLTNCTLSGNSANNNGGAIYNNSTGTLTLTGCTLNGNSATAKGGAIYANNNSDLTSTTTTLTNCTLSGNTAAQGGGIDG